MQGTAPLCEKKSLAVSTFPVSFKAPSEFRRNLGVVGDSGIVDKTEESALRFSDSTEFYAGRRILEQISQIFRFCCSADSGPRLPANQLNNNLTRSGPKIPAAGHSEGEIFGIYGLIEPFLTCPLVHCPMIQ